VVAFSSGNHAQAVAPRRAAARIPATIVMPADAPAVKAEATRGYGARVVLYDRSRGENREEVAARIAAETGATVIPPFDHPAVIAGQGTAAKELIEDVGPLDDLFVCCGGAGLLSGCAIAAHTSRPGSRWSASSPRPGRRGAFVSQQAAGGDRGPADDRRRRAHAITGRDHVPLVLAHVQDIVTVDDAALVEAMRFLWERMKLVVEPTGALATARGDAGQARRARHAGSASSCPAATST
jgi:threonine dehydratase